MLIGSPVEAIERELVLQRLARCHGDRTHAARVLGLRSHDPAQIRVHGKARRRISAHS